MSVSDFFKDVNVIFKNFILSFLNKHIWILISKLFENNLFPILIGNFFFKTTVCNEDKENNNQVFCTICQHQHAKRKDLIITFYVQ